MQVIGVSGKAESGKTTTSVILQEELKKRGIKVCLVNYGDLVKYVAKQYYDWHGTKDRYGRTLLQHIGTDLGRGKVHPAVWINMIIYITKILQYDYDMVIVGDCRFPNEYEEWNNHKDEFEMVKLHIDRPNHENKLTEEQRQHPSETALDNFQFDYTIINDSDLSDLRKKVNSFIDEKIKLDFK